MTSRRGTARVRLLPAVQRRNDIGHRVIDIHRRAHHLACAVARPERG